MSASTFGFDEIEFKHLLPRVALVFLLMNTSIFFIDGIIELSNALITAVGKVSGASSVWDTLTSVVKEAGGQGLAALIMMMAFIVFSVILLVYYVGRLVTLFIGAVLSPLVTLLWLVPGFRDFAETAFKTWSATDGKILKTESPKKVTSVAKIIKSTMRGCERMKSIVSRN